VPSTPGRTAVDGAASNPWPDGTIVGFDLETTGTDPVTARIVTAALVYHRPDASGGEGSRTWLVDPGIEIPERATAVHGITTAAAREHGIPAADAVGEIVAALEAVWRAGLPLVVFNAAYDLSLMAAAMLRHGLGALADLPSWHGACIIDPLVIDRAVDRYRKGKRTLQAAAEHYRVAATDPHSADGDAVAACLVARAIAEAFPAVAAAERAALMAQQEEWSLAWAQRFQAFLRSKGRADAVIDGTWPLRGV
jgi:DNA polymerase-3 subunit epsilon